MTSQDARVAAAVRAAYDGSPLVARGLDEAGASPDAVRGVADLALLPFMTKEDIREAPVADWALCRPDAVRVHCSSGTTGRRTVCGYTAHDLDDWAAMMARCYEFAGVGAGDRVQLGVGQGLSAAGEGFQLGADRIGALTVPVGPGDTERQVAMLREFGSTVLCATSSFALLLAEREAAAPSPGLALRIGMVGSERMAPQVRERVQRLLGVELFDVYGATELWGPGAGVECAWHEGIHVWSDHYVVEVVAPDTLQPVGSGEVGELVVTTLAKQASPLVRFRTRDLACVLQEPCPCGSPYPRISPLLGRTDDLVKVRGVGFHPVQVEQALSDVDPAAQEYQVHLHPGAHGGVDVLVMVEARRDPALVDRFAGQLRLTTGLRMRVEPVPVGTLPRSAAKTRRLFDHRPS